jgi:hypothetical protein
MFALSKEIKIFLFLWHNVPLKEYEYNFFYGDTYCYIFICFQGKPSWWILKWYRGKNYMYSLNYRSLGYRPLTWLICQNPKWKLTTTRVTELDWHQTKVIFYINLNFSVLPPIFGLRTLTTQRFEYTVETAKGISV